MISAEVIKGVQELLVEHGVRQGQDEKFGDFVARGLGISARQAEILLASLHDGQDVEEALSAADIDQQSVDRGFIVRMGRAIGNALGQVRGFSSGQSS
jgi:hypothetical protein